LTGSRKFSPCPHLFLSLLTSVLCVLPASGTVQRLELHTGWQFRALNKDAAAEFQQWHPAKVPGVVQTDLLDNKLISDPCRNRMGYTPRPWCCRI